MIGRLRAWWDRIRCETLGWHAPGQPITFVGRSFAGRCCRCSRRILTDAQGNWFSVVEREETEEDWEAADGCDVEEAPDED